MSAERVDMTGVVVIDQGRPVAPYLEREAWKRQRIDKIGSSDTAAILGLDEYTGPWEVWDRIVLGDWKDRDEAGDIRRGRKQEAVARETFCERTGLEVKELTMIHHAEEPRIVSDLDGLIQRPMVWPRQILESEVWSQITSHEGPGALELKVPRISKFYRLKEEGLPQSHILQHQHHLMVAGLSWGFFAFYTPEYDDIVAFPVIRDDEFCMWLFRALRQWWRDHVVAGKRPERFAPEPPRWPKAVPGTAALREDEPWMVQTQLLAIRHYELEEAKAAYGQTEGGLLELLDESDQHVAGGGVSVTRRSTKSQRRTDWDAFRAAVKLAQKDHDTEALLALDPDDDAFKYQTQTSERVEVVVRAPNPMEMVA